MSKTGKRRHRKRHRKKHAERRRSINFSLPAISLSGAGRLKVLTGLLVLAALASAGLTRCNTKEVHTTESEESIRLKQQMLNQFIQKEETMQEIDSGTDAAREAR